MLFKAVRHLGSKGPASHSDARALLLTTTLALVAIGLMMVLSASSFELAAQGKSPYETFYKQALWVGIGLAVLVVFSRLPLHLFRRYAGLILIGSFVLTLLVFTPLGIEVNGNRNWIGIGPITVQPSEFLKLGTIIWGANVLARRTRSSRNLRPFLFPVLPVSLAAVALVLAGKDLGTAAILVLIIAGLFFFAGASLTVFGAGLAVFALAAFAAVISSSNRTSRISAWLDPASAGTAEGLGYQGVQATYGLAGGGMFGVGMGQSRQKVHWIPEAHNDFIFAVLGEELGFVGAAVMLILFATLAFAIYRIATLSGELHVTLICGGALVWILAQTVLNISVVTGLVPVVGVPLPFISYGGSSMISLLALTGVLLSCSRHSERTATNN
ncbi:cell division protein FtsW [Arthrobacter sp. CAN_A6]|uniref:putative lipid II flippase FtsW n=1 Tax=Arthrobacter sp. CAN_A6 TaxID=2787721 RepID=UPI0018CA634D